MEFIVTVVTFLDAVATIQCRCPFLCIRSKQQWHKFCQNVNCTFCMNMKLSSRFDSKNKQTCLQLLILANFITFLPHEIPCDIAFIPCEKIAGQMRIQGEG